MIGDPITWLTANPDQANALAAVTNVVVATLALLVAAVSIGFTLRGLRIQRQHNHLSVRPIPFIALADYEDHLRVKVRNDGIGPLIVKSVSILENGAKKHDELVGYMPTLPPGLSWSNFSSGYVRSIPTGGEIILVELKLDLTKGHHTHFRDEVRAALEVLTVVVDYTDIYGTEFTREERHLDWFGRRLASSKSVN